MKKNVKLSVYGEDYFTWDSSTKALANIISTTVVAVLLVGFSFLWALILDYWLGFIDFSYFEWVKIMIVVSWFSLGRTMEIVRIKEGLKSVLRRV